MAVGVPPGPYALFHVRATYTVGTGTNHFGGAIRRSRFTLQCRSRRSYMGLYGRLSWRERLCIALLDYRTRTPRLTFAGCRCPASVVWVDVRGSVAGRPVHMRFTPCLCGDGPQAAADVRLILRTHPHTAGDVA